MAMFQTICFECWECKQKCIQYIDNIQDSGNDGFKQENCKEYKVKNLKTKANQ